MKYASRIALVLAVSFVSIAFIYLKFFYVPVTNIDNSITKATTLENTTKSDEKVLLSKLEDKGIYLYMKGDQLILKQNKYETKFDIWSDKIDEEKPEIYYFDCSYDNKPEIIIKYYIGKDEATNTSTYEIAILSVTDNKDGTYSYYVNLLNHSVATNLFNSSITQEVSQLVANNKRIQFSMALIGQTIEYNKNTGIAQNGYSNYGLALKKNKTEYATLESWRKGNMQFSIKDNKIIVSIDVFIKYAELDEEQQIGQISFGINLSKEQIAITGSSLYYKSYDKYTVSRPSNKSVNDWNYILKNSKVQSTSKDKISFVSKSFNIDSKTKTTSSSFSADTGDSKYIDSIKVCKNKVVLYSKIDKPFSSSAIKNGEYSVIINEGTKYEYEISNWSAITTNNKNQSVLTIKFDKDYKKSEISSIKIIFGA